MGKGFIACIRNHFGVQPGKKLSDMAKEIKELSAQDRWDLVSGFQSGHGTDTLLEDVLEKERLRAKEAGVVKAGKGYGELVV